MDWLVVRFTRPGNGVEQHERRTWVESEEGRGSTFSFFLPIAQELPG